MIDALEVAIVVVSVTVIVVNLIGWTARKLGKVDDEDSN